mmetsp:Transcript_28971/g.32012  ORF Transcript_28971/g.32012 Transcript_28971/m.32012 type:complete len:1047 (-) Transcript_28971:83-3223(-)
MSTRNENDGNLSPTTTANYTGINIVNKFPLEVLSNNEPLEGETIRMLQLKSGKVNMDAVMKDGLVTVPQLNTSILDELDSKGEEDSSIPGFNESFESSPVANQDFIENFRYEDEFKEEVQWQSSALSLLSLPGDSLHCIASFLKAPDWASFGQTSTTATTICRKVLTRVRMHGFLCATEVVTAWKLGQHADARELSALYIKAGVPIYPYSLGHSYRTLAWRMDVEAKELSNRKEGNAENENESLPIDQFFIDRHELRMQDENNVPNVTHLEEKCLHYFNKAAGTDSRYRTRISLSSRANYSTPSSSTILGMQELINGSRLARGSMNGNDPSNHGFATPLPLCPSDQSQRAPKLKLKVHRHLADQHLLCRPTVNDEQGAMVTPSISLAVDFFHQPIQRRNMISISSISSNSRGSLWDNRRENSLGSNAVGAPLIPRSSCDTGSITSLLPSIFSCGATFDNINCASSRKLSNFVGKAKHRVEDQMSSQKPEVSILSTFDLLIYNSTSPELAYLHDDGNAIKQSLESRFTFYQTKLESLISRYDSFAFEECILDFWDEFLPVTENIHHHDGNTVVPRISRLENFLSKPCSKALGVIQCEIERVKVCSKKRVNMKGRLFPSYEYRLFIRDRRQEAQQETSVQEETDVQRRDSILMVAKNKGRKHLESTGIVTSAGTSKKGVNNFYLHTPGKNDVDAHFRAANQTEKASFSSNGANVQQPTRPSDKNKKRLLGRLRSNFVGTEFQIFTPIARKDPSKQLSGMTCTNNNGAVSSDSENDYDVPSSRRRLLNCRKSNNTRRIRGSSQSKRSNNIHQSQVSHEEEIVESPLIDARKKLKKSYSLPNFRKLPRSSRRVVANSDDSNTQQQQTVLCEEEVGAITYTANLLGNRPRIMDVCVPRVLDDGVSGTEWEEYLNSVADNEATDSMLAHFKQLQQRSEGNEQPDNQTRDGNELEENGEPVSPGNFGLQSLQNRPPWWNVELGAFVLNFGGRVSVASVKNFQLCDRQDQDHIMLQFGRIQGRHSFTMDYQYPLTAVQAFAIAISSLQSRISFG